MSGDRSEVLPDMLPRIRVAAQKARDLEDRLRLAIEARDQLVEQAVDEGVTQRAVADALGVSRSRVVAILGNRGSVGR